ncbi:MAG: hypothetical protein SF162_20825 [bacterium]|nr:hypothetical protein [bacterium]
MPDSQHVPAPKAPQPAKSPSPDGQIPQNEIFSTADDAPAFSPGALLRLQRMVGNRAVVQLAAQRQAAASKQAASKQTVNPTPAPKGIRRAVGFEFENNTWNSFQKVRERGESKSPPKSAKRFEGRTFALGMIIEDPKAFENDDVINMFSNVPRLFRVRDYVMRSFTMPNKKALIELLTGALTTPNKDANPLGKDNELDEIFLKFANYVNYTINQVFGADLPMHPANTVLLQTDKNKLARLMAEIVADTLIVVSKDDMTDGELDTLSDEFTGTNVYQDPKTGNRDDENPHVQFEGLESAGKKGELHSESGFKIEPDGPNDKERMNMDIEFVTAPFEESSAGLKDLKRVLKRIRTISFDLAKYAGRDFRKGEFVRPPENKMSAGNVYLSGGSANPAFQMQVTHGVPLSDLPTLMKYLGTKPEFEGREEAEERSGARRMMGWENPEKANKTSDFIGAAPGLAREVINSLIADYHILSDDDNLPVLEGFFAYALMYIMQLDRTDPEGIKISVTLMSRFSFDQLLMQIDAETRKELSSGAHLVALAIEKAIQKSGLIPGFTLARPMMNLRFTPNKYKDRGHDPFFDLLKKVAVGDWILGIFVDKVDLLTASSMKEFLKAAGEDPTPYDKSFNIFSRGHGDSSRLIGETDSLAVMENRGINALTNNSPTNMDQTEDIALAYMEFMIRLKEAKGDEDKVGKFPKMKSVPRQV